MPKGQFQGSTVIPVPRPGLYRDWTFYPGPGPGEKGQFGRDFTGILKEIFRSKW
ncbi:MAG: hypothetical protein GY820_25595 [Gammaproteobacteria bacterium]|nr:hypothetical protein [Gammaproteobacteria bacterium]